MGGREGLKSRLSPVENSAIRICKVDETGFNNDIYKSNVHSN